MPNGHYPLLFFPTPTTADRRNPLPNGRGPVVGPSYDRQRARLTPQLQRLQQALEAKRIQLQQSAPLENPELVLVLEVVGGVERFANAIRKIPGLEWLFELAEDQIVQDDDFHVVDEAKRHMLLAGRLYLLGTNQEALRQLLALWERYTQNPEAPFDRGLNPIKSAFKLLRTIRPWDASDRVNSDVRDYWRDQIAIGVESISFEIEAWHFASATKNEATEREIIRLVDEMGGRTLSHSLIKEISYHGFLVELPIAAIREILDGAVPSLLLSDRIMFFRPRGQSSTQVEDEEELSELNGERARTLNSPIVALLDGLPMGNHALLADRLIIDDPDGWEVGYEAKDRVHGTAMASLILHGELDAQSEPLKRKLYVRPIMRPDMTDGVHARRIEQTPGNELLVDLVHRAVKRICEGDAGQPPAAPSVRVVNLSMGDTHRVFSLHMSPWARLIDWLSHRYSILFVVSAGNASPVLELQTPRSSLAAMEVSARHSLALTALVRTDVDRRLIAPAESINALTVGAMHADEAESVEVPNRFDLFPANGISPASRLGHGYRRSIKPDILMPGGRMLHMEQLIGDPEVTVVESPNLFSKPGQRVAIPASNGQSLNETAHSRGTSNAASLASRAAAQIYEGLEALRADTANAPGSEYDAVLLKALLVHGAAWGNLPEQLLGVRPDLRDIENATRRRNEQKNFFTRWLGHGPVDVERAIACTAQRATLLGVGELGADEALLFSAPLPPGLSGVREWRRMTITLAWISPVNAAHQSYRRAKLWISNPGEELRVRRTDVDDKAARRGTVQHEILEGEDAVAYVDGATFTCKVNCAADAGPFRDKVRFALCVSLEVGVESAIEVYQEIRQRIAPQVGVRPT